MNAFYQIENQGVDSFSVFHSPLFIITWFNDGTKVRRITRPVH
jgi:hypothetical protein